MEKSVCKGGSRECDRAHDLLLYASVPHRRFCATLYLCVGYLFSGRCGVVDQWLVRARGNLASKLLIRPVEAVMMRSTVCTLPLHIRSVGEVREVSPAVRTSHGIFGAN